MEVEAVELGERRSCEEWASELLFVLTFKTFVRICFISDHGGEGQTQEKFEGKEHGVKDRRNA